MGSIQRRRAIKTPAAKRQLDGAGKGYINHYAVKNVHFKLYDEDAELLKHLVAISSITQIGTCVFRAYYFQWKATGVELERPPFEYALIPIPLPLWDAYTKQQKSLTREQMMLAAIQTFIANHRSKLPARDQGGRAKSNSSRRWNKHFQVSYINFNLFDSDAENASELKSFTSFANICVNGLRAYYYSLLKFYSHDLLDIFQGSFARPDPEHVLIPVPSKIWDEYIALAQQHYNLTASQISVESWMLEAIKSRIDPTSAKQPFVL
jgi:hypothetical protein